MNSIPRLTVKSVFPVLICCFVLAQARAQNLRAATASSYVERGNQWFAKGEGESKKSSDRWHPSSDRHSCELAGDQCKPSPAQNPKEIR